MEQAEPKQYLYSNADLRKLIWPLVVEQFLAIFVGMLDTIMISGSGEAAVSGVSLVDNITILVINFMAALGTGGAVVAGHYLGQKHKHHASRAGWQLILFSAFFSAVLVVILIGLRGPIMSHVFGAVEPDVMQSANTYLVITGVSIFPLAIYSSCAGLLRAMSQSRETMLISLLMNLINLFGNALLIYVFHMGVAGAAISTTVSRTVSAVIAFALLMNDKRPITFRGYITWKPDFGLLKRILFIGVPNGLENSLFQLGKILLLSLISTFGTSAIAANQVCNIVSSVAQLPSAAINLAIVSVCSVCVGAGDFVQVRYYTRKLCILSEICLIVLCTACWFATPMIVRAFSLTEATQALAITVGRTYYVMAVLFWIWAFAVCNTMRCAGDVVHTMKVSLFSMWIFRVISAYVIEHFFHLGLMSVWIAMYIDWIFRGICFFIRYRGHEWEHAMLK